jgi:DNA polymerase-3 subunit gamma/tau
LSLFIFDFCWYLRNLLLIQMGGNTDEILDVSTESRRAMEEEAAMVSSENLMRNIRILSELSNQMKYASQKRVLAEIALIKLTRPQMEQNYDAVVNRLAIVERQLEETKAVLEDLSVEGLQELALAKGRAAGVADKKTGTQNSGSLRGMDAGTPAPSIPQSAVPEDIHRAAKAMKQVVEQMGSPVKNFLAQARYQAGGENRLIVVTHDELAEQYLQNPERRGELEQRISQAVGKKISVEIKLARPEANRQDSFQTAQENIRMNIEVED